jgi:hypothetical protein
MFDSKGKSNVHPITGHEGPEREKRYSSALSLTSALDGVGGQHHALAALPPGKTRYPLRRRLGRPQGRPGRGRKTQPQRYYVYGSFGKFQVGEIRKLM